MSATNPFSINQTNLAPGNTDSSTIDDAINPFSINQTSAAPGNTSPTGTTVTQPYTPPSATGGTTALLSARGAFYQVSLAQTAAGASQAFYAVDNLTINPDQKSPQSPILLDGVQFRDSDIVGRVPCLNNYKVYYSFGQNFGDISIAGVVLLGPLGNVKTDGVNRLRDFFATYRVSVYNKPIAVHIVDKAYYMYLEGMQIMAIDREFHILPFMLSGTMIDISRNTSASLNPKSVVISDKNLDSGSLATALSVLNPQIENQMTSSTTPTPSTNSDEENPDNPGQLNSSVAPPINAGPTAASLAAANQAAANAQTTPVPGTSYDDSLATPPSTTSPITGPATDPNAVITAKTVGGIPLSNTEANYPTLVDNTAAAQANADAVKNSTGIGTTLGNNYASADQQQQAQDAQNQLAAAQAAQTTAGNYIVNKYNATQTPPPVNYGNYVGSPNPPSTVEAAPGLSQYGGVRPIGLDNPYE